MPLRHLHCASSNKLFHLSSGTRKVAFEVSGGTLLREVSFTDHGTKYHRTTELVKNTLKNHAEESAVWVLVKQS